MTITQPRQGYISMSSMHLVTKNSILTPCPAYPHFCSHSLHSAAFHQQHRDTEVYNVTGAFLSTLCWGCWLTAHWIWAGSVPRWPKRPITSWLISEMETVWPAGLGKWSSPCTQRWWGRTLNTVFSFGRLTTRHWGAGVCPKKGNEAGEGSREQVQWRAAEGTGVV